MTHLLTPRPAPVAPITDATRREFLTALAAAGLLTGCATGGPGTVPAPATRTVTDTTGQVTVPADPRRAATTFYPTLIALAGLGVPVVAAARESLDQIVDLPEAFRPPGLDGLTDVGSQDSPNLEALATTRPDLFVGVTGRSDEILDRLQAIAPTVVLDFATGRWREHVADVARVVGREDRLAELVALFDEAAAAARAALPDPPAVAVIRATIDNGMFLSESSNSFEGSVLTAAGVPLAPGTAEPIGEFADVGVVEHSEERLGEVLGRADVIVIKVFAGEGGIATYAGSPLWQNLPPCGPDGSGRSATACGAAAPTRPRSPCSTSSPTSSPPAADRPIGFHPSTG